MDPGTQTMIIELIRVSVLAPVVLALAWFAWTQHKSLRQVEAKRVQDLSAIVDRLIELSTSSKVAISEHTRSLESYREAIKEVREALRELELRR